MASQADKDWEEYQLGQQGTQTGSAYNQAGQNDSYVPAHTPPRSKKQKKRRDSNQQIIEPLATMQIVNLAHYLQRLPLSL